MSLDQAERDHSPDGELGESVTSAPSAPRRAYTLFVGDAAAGFDASSLCAVHESRMTVGDIVVHAAILDDAHFVRVLVRGRPRFVELFGFAIAAGIPTRRIRYVHEHGIDLEIFNPSVSIRTRARSSIGRSGGWRGVTHPGDRAHALALAHCLSTNPSAPRTVVGVTVDQIDETTSVRIDAVHEYATRSAFNVIACETRLRLTASGEY